jgi:anthranilate/para-aminobenzoate synthase component II
MGVRSRGTAAALEGVQFHPESIMTAVGKQLLANFLRMAGQPRPAGTGAATVAP